MSRLNSASNLETGAADDNVALPLWPLGLFTLWDFYISGIRPLDHLGGLVLLLALFYQRSRKMDSDGIWKFAAVGFYLLWLVLMGTLQNPDAIKPSFGLMEGVIIALAVASSRWRSGDMIKLLRIMIIIHVTALYFQFLLYIIFHYSLNYQAWTGAQLRTFTGLGMRPAGLFLEPAGYGLMMFSLLALFRLVGGQARWLEVAAVVSMGLTVSLWAWAAAAAYIIIFHPKVAAGFLPLILAGFLYAAAAINPADFNKNIIAFHILRRVLNPSKDGSSQARYGGLFSGDLNDPSLWFGHGLTNDYDMFGANGLSFILYAGGIAGVVAIAILWFMVLPRGRRLKGTMALCFMLSAASQWTFVWWWVWLAIGACTGSDGLDAIRRGLRNRLEIAHVNTPARS